MQVANKTKIDFFIVGKPKSGTTALSYFLNQHPKIFIAKPKEPGYFCKDLQIESDKFHGKQLYYPIRNSRQYLKLFSEAKPNQLLGEASTTYLYSKSASKLIYKHNPDAKIIIMLRNPVDFMQSLHMQMVNETKEDIIDFQEALSVEQKRQKGFGVPRQAVSPSLLFYRERAKYYKDLKRYFNIFPKENIRVIITEDFSLNNKRVYKETLKFLGVAQYKDVSFSVIHESKKARSQKLNRLLNNQKFKNLLFKIVGAQTYTTISKQVASIILKKQKRKALPAKIRSKLVDEFKDEISKSQNLIDKDLSLWLR